MKYYVKVTKQVAETIIKSGVPLTMTSDGNCLLYQSELNGVKGVNLNAINPRGQHALHIALQVPALKVADYLAKRPAVNIDERNAKDETPLMLAVLKGHIGLARILIEREADVNKTGWAPLHYAATYGGPVAVEGSGELSADAPADGPGLCLWLRLPCLENSAA